MNHEHASKEPSQLKGFTHCQWTVVAMIYLGAKVPKFRLLMDMVPGRTDMSSRSPSQVFRILRQRIRAAREIVQRRSINTDKSS